MRELDADVALVGFGPVGAALAGLLGKRGLRVVVIDRETDVYPLPRAAHIDHQSLRTLQELDILHTLLPEMVKNSGLDFVTPDRELLISIPSERPSVSGLPTSMYFHQPGFDRTLRAAVTSLPGVTVVLGETVTEVRDEGDRVTLFSGVTGFGESGERWVEAGERRAITAAWVVGCDGARSFVRESSGIEQESLDFDEKWLVVDLLLGAPVPSLPSHALAVCDPRRPMFVIPMPGARFRFEIMLLPGEASAELQRPSTVERLIADWIPPGVATIERAATYEFHGLVARPWRAGRHVFIAGDAAHLMPPFLGQGMCSGLRDAGNLAWKLDLVARHGAPEALLDTYESERRPHVRTIVKAAVELGRILCELDPDAAVARDRRLLESGLTPAERRRFGLPSLEPGPLVGRRGGHLFPQPPGFGPGAGFDDRIGQRFLVLGRDRAALTGADAWRDALGAVVISAADEPSEGAWLSEWLARRSSAVAVVRPDRYVLACGDDLAAISSRVLPLLGATAPSGAG